MPGELMVVYVTNSDFDARVVAGLLESEGIPTLVQQEPAGRIYGLSVGALGEVKVAVRAADYERALDIIDGEPMNTVLLDENEIPDDDNIEE